MPFFDEETAQRIRFLHFKSKHLEEALNSDLESFNLDDCALVLEYTMILNVNYGQENHKRLLTELKLSPSFYDPKANEEIQIFDLMFECARALWILARAYAQLSEQFEDEEDWENSIIAMIESSKMYKTAAYFSAASIFQRKKGIVLQSENLELQSEEGRNLAQSLTASREETEGNIYFASKLYAGLSAMSKRLFYLRKHEEKKKQQIRAQFHFDMGKACQLKAKASIESSLTNVNQEKVTRLKQKANFYYSKSKKIWTKMLEKLIDISEEEKESLKINISIAEDLIEENDVEDLNYEQIKRIQDPEPIVLVPENLAPFVPKSTVFLTKFVPKDVNIKRFKKFKGKRLEKKIPYSKEEKLKDKKAGLIRTINELKMLKENNEVGIDKFTELMEKYSIKLKMIDTAIDKLAKKS